MIIMSHPVYLIGVVLVPVYKSPNPVRPKKEITRDKRVPAAKTPLGAGKLVFRLVLYKNFAKI